VAVVAYSNDLSHFLTYKFKQFTTDISMWQKLKSLINQGSLIK